MDEFYSICSKCGGTGKIPRGSWIPSFLEPLRVINCSNPLCNRGLILTPLGEHLMNFLCELKKRKWEPSLW
jgi:hypothetical protein